MKTIKRACLNLKLLLYKLSNKSASEQDAHAWLHANLQKTPYWVRGHKEYALTSLRMDKVAEAYASALAVLELSRHKPTNYLANFIIGLCCLRRGAFDRAISTFQLLIEENPKDWNVHEQLAAAYYGKGDSIKETLNCLSRVPEEYLSNESKILKNYLEHNKDGSTEVNCQRT